MRSMRCFIGLVWNTRRKNRWPSIISAMSAGSASSCGETSGIASGSALRSLTNPRERGLTTTVVIVTPKVSGSRPTDLRSSVHHGHAECLDVGMPCGPSD